MLSTRVRNITRSIISTLTPSEIMQFAIASISQHKAYIREYNTDSLNDYAQKQLLLILSHTAKTVPFYKKSWHKVGITESTIKSQKEILQYLPLVDKIQLQKQGYKQLLSKISKPSTLSKSSGTTGNEVFRFMDRDATILNHTTVVRYLRDNHAPIGSTILFALSDKFVPLYWKPVPLQFLSQRIFISFSTLLENPKIFDDLNVDVVVGSPHKLQALAKEFFAKRNLKPPQLFISIAERLDTHQRNIIELYTGSTVIDVYCGSEFSTLIAFECRQCKNLHTNSDYILVEVLDSEGNPVPKGGVGEVVITDLCNFVSPLIRYRTGDLVTVSDNALCDCNRALPVQIKKIEGRITDKLTLVGGNKISALPLLDKLRILLRNNFTLIQEDINQFLLQLHEHERNQMDFKISTLGIQEILNEYLKSNVTIKINSDHLVNRINQTQGKIRSFVSRIPL